MSSLQKILGRLREYRMSMRTRLALGLGSIAAMLLLSSIISVLEYRRMSNYVTDLVADNIRNINVAQKLVSMSDEYNLKVLAAIGEEDSTSVSVPYFDRKAFMEQCDGLRTSISSEEAFPLADSVIYAYSAYMLTSLELPGVELRVHDLVGRYAAFDGDHTGGYLLLLHLDILSAFTREKARECCALSHSLNKLKTKLSPF